MVERIIVTDGDWSQDNVRLTPRQTLPFPVGTLPEGEYHLTNTRTRGTPYEIAGQEMVVVTNPRLSGSAIVGRNISRESGTALGAQNRVTEWLLNGTILDGLTGGSLSTVGMEEDDKILTRDKWTTVINDETITVYGTSEEWTLQAAPVVNAVELVEPLGNVSLTVGDDDLVVNYDYDEDTEEGHFRHATDYVRSPATAPAGFIYNGRGHVVDASAPRAPTGITVIGRGADGSSIPSSATYQVAAPVVTGDDLAVYLPDGTFEVDAATDATLVLTIDPPHVHAGTYTLTPPMMALMANGPICLVPAVIDIDGLLTQYSMIRQGLWVADMSRGPFQVARQWLNNGAAIQGATGNTLAFADAYRGRNVTLRERAQQGVLERTQASNAVNIAANYLPTDFFATRPSNGMALTGYVGDSGEAWTKIDAGSSAFTIYDDAIAGGNSSGPVYIRGAANRGAAQFAEAKFRYGSSSERSGIALSVRTQGNSGYELYWTTVGTTYANGAWRLRRRIDGVNTTIATVEGPLPGFAAPGDLIDARVEINGDQLRFQIGDTWHGPYTDATLSGGGVGLIGHASNTGISATSPLSFNGGSL